METKDTTTVSLPTSLGVATYPPGASFGPRQMTDWEFVWLLQGTAEYRSDSTTFSLVEGSVVLCRPGATDFFQWDQHQQTRHAYFHFQMVVLPEDRQEWPLVRPPEDEDVLLPLFRHVLVWSDQGDPDLVRLTIQMMLTAFRTGQRTTKARSQALLPPAVAQVCAYIHERLDADPAAAISLGRLAEHACVTQEHLCRLFKSSLGHSPAETVRLARLDRAATLLARSNYAVAAIAELCGFASPFHFSRAFKQIYGLAPRDLRRRLQSGEMPPLSRLLQTSRHSF